MAWRRSSAPQVDPRRCEGKPLRKAIDVSFLAGFWHDGTDDEPREKPYLYEAQTTCLVGGLDNHVWDSAGLVDTYFEENLDSRRNCEYFEDMCESLQPNTHVRPDLIPAGEHLVNSPIWTPREYFLMVLESRLAQIVKEWVSLVDWTRRDIVDYVCSHCHARLHWAI